MTFENLESVLSAEAEGGAVYFEGQIVKAKDFDGIYIVQSPSHYYSVPSMAIIGTTPERNGRTGVFVNPNEQIWTSSATWPKALYEKPNFRVEEEDIAAPKKQFLDGDPAEWSTASREALTAGRTLEGTCKAYDGSCNGGGSFNNNCAHYLSDAFINAGFSELNQSQSCVEVRCNQDSTCNLGSYLKHRVIRAKNLRCWFASKATKTATKVAANSGFWAAYQERASDGQGHVAIIDTNTWTYYGTGWFSDWTQDYYQW